MCSNMVGHLVVKIIIFKDTLAISRSATDQYDRPSCGKNDYI